MRDSTPRHGVSSSTIGGCGLDASGSNGSVSAVLDVPMATVGMSNRTVGFYPLVNEPITQFCLASEQAQLEEKETLSCYGS